jgi:anaerobic magnesium-protoporphyrin IX monomethyl ester cyclase
LSSYLRERGFSVHQIDLNLAFYLWLLRRERILDAYHKASAPLAGPGPLDESLADLALSVVGGPYLAEHCARALHCIKDAGTFYRVEQYGWAMATLEHACRVWSAQWKGLRLGVGRLWLPDGPRLERLTQLAVDGERNPFYCFLESEVATLVESLKPRLVGVSVVQEDQLLAALTIGGLVHRLASGVRVVLGGSLITTMAMWWGDSEPLAGLADMLVIGPGEEALEGLLRNRPLAAIPNLVAARHWPSKVWSGSVSRGPTPDFVGLPLEDYLSPETVYPLVATRGCYWNRCAFCNLTAHGPVYEYRTSSRLVADMERLNARHGARLFDLAGEVVSLRNLMSLGREVRSRGLSARWQAPTRLDTPLGRRGAEGLYAGGCRRLMFGLESGCERVLGLMDKGIDQERARRILGSCEAAGIALTLYILVGFPGEIADEARETARFLLSEEKLLRSRGLTLAFSCFRLRRNSRVAAAPGRYGVQVLGPVGDASVSMLYETQRGMGPREAEDVRSEIAETVLSQCGGRAWPSASAHSLLYLEHGEGGGADENGETKGYTLSEFLDARPRLRADVHALQVGSWAAVYDGRTATLRRLGPRTWAAGSLCDGQRTGSQVCAELEAAGLSSGEALMALAKALATGVLER